MLSDTRAREGIESSHIFRYQGTIAYPTKREISDSEVAGDGRGYVIRSFRRVASHALGHLENGQATI